MSYRVRCLIPACLSALLAWPAWAEPGVVIREDVLRQSPSVHGAQVGPVRQGTSVELLERQGAWRKVRVGELTGWLRALMVRAGTPASSSGTSLKDITALTTTSGRPVTAVTGLRGLDEVALREASFDSRELDKLNSYGVSQKDARKFAMRGQLVARQVDVLAAPKSASTTSQPAQGNDKQPDGGFNLLEGF